jgi:hypothetical protein
MLIYGDLEVLFRDQKTDRVERKASIADPSKIKEAICAVANAYLPHGQPGVVFVVEIKEGKSHERDDVVTWNCTGGREAEAKPPAVAA